MKYFIVLILSALNLNAQNEKVYVEYDVKSHLLFSDEYLIATNQNAVYYNKSLEFNFDDKITQNEDGSYEVLPKKITTPAKKYYGDVSTNIIHILNLGIESQLIVIDSLPTIDWKIVSNDTKNILGFECQKAKAYFRGSKIEAYFTTELPYPFGPYKFRGLPGLILEVYNIEDVYKFSWVAKKIILPFKEDIDVDFKIEKYNFETITLKKLHYKFLEKMRAKRAKLKTSQPRGTSVGNITTKRINIEKVYEWEK